MGFATVWQFEVREGNREEFERIYGPAGEWARLFGRAHGFVETLLIRAVDEPSRYLTVDRWQTRDDWLNFHHAFADEYRLLDERTAGLAHRDTPLGDFDEIHPAG